MTLIDAHCHLESHEFDDILERILEDAHEAGVAKLVTAAITPEQWDVSQALAERLPEVVFALGVHPWYIQPGDLARLDGLCAARDRGAVAIGEIGLDNKVDSPAMDVQLPVFEAQLCIACELNLPVVLHCRGAFGDLVRTIKRVGVPKAGGIVHAFSGSVELAEELMALNLSFSMGGALTFRNSKKRQRVLERIYPGHFLLETDSPDIPPVECRDAGRPNVPANIRYNLAAASELLGIDEETVAEVTTANACRIFGFDC